MYRLKSHGHLLGQQLLVKSTNRGRGTAGQRAWLLLGPGVVGEACPYLLLRGQRTLLHDVLNHHLASGLLQVAMVSHGADHLHHGPFHLSRTNRSGRGQTETAMPAQPFPAHIYTAHTPVPTPTLQPYSHLHLSL